MTHAYLIPGITLQDRVRNLQHGATLIGDIAERIVKKVCKAEHSTFEADELAPDLDYCGGHIECKAFKTSTRCLIHKRQLERYASLPCSTWYAFVSYSHKNPVPKRASKMQVIHNLCSTLDTIYIVDLKTILTACGLADSGEKGYGNRRARLFFHGREPIERDYLTLSVHAVDALTRTKTGYPVDTFKRKVTVTYEDEPFTTKYFNVVKSVEPVPF